MLVAAAALVGMCADEVIHDDPVVLDNDGQLDTTGLCSTRYLFGSIFTNAYHKTNPRPYLERSRGIVDLNGDGKLDVILEFNESYRARIGNGYNVFLWTNGLYRCVGEIWGPNRLGSRIITILAPPSGPTAPAAESRARSADCGLATTGSCPSRHRSASTGMAMASRASPGP